MDVLFNNPQIQEVEEEKIQMALDDHFFPNFESLLQSLLKALS
jgi:hypothetical protein